MQLIAIEADPQMRDPGRSTGIAVTWRLQATAQSLWISLLTVGQVPAPLMTVLKQNKNALLTDLDYNPRLCS